MAEGKQPLCEIQDSKQVMDPKGSNAEDFMSSKRGESVFLPRPDGAVLTIGPLEDTEYKDRPTVVNGWGKFYLPNITKMKVIGYVEGTSYPCDQLVLMTCEEKKVYGFDGEELHLVAFSLDQMFTKGIADPALQSYYYGEAFKDMSEEDWEEVKQSPVGKMLNEEHRQLVVSHKSAFLEIF
uniref:US22 family protein n=2 Tax=Poecilia formosa TaxID=48698 RepID=A0A096LRS8_POEFO